MNLKLVTKTADKYRGNESTGSLECLRSFVDIEKLDGNWVLGRAKGTDDAKVQIKMFAEPSLHGIASRSTSWKRC